MKCIRNAATIFLFFIVFQIGAQDRRSSAPYISGDTFRMFCKFSYDEFGNNVIPSDLQDGDTVFVKGDLIDEFWLLVHPTLDSRYILVTHNSDNHVTSDYIDLLDDEHLIAWFGQNVVFDHPKLHRIPIGIANRCWSHGNIETVKRAQEFAKNSGRDVLAYLNIAVGNYFAERNLVADLFTTAPYCYASRPKDHYGYLCDLAQTKFVFSPRGNGIDCHRTWESLLMGAFPIVKTSPLDPLYDGLPVLIVDEWENVDQQYLEIMYGVMRLKSYSLERIYSGYWLKKIQACRDAITDLQGPL